MRLPRESWESSESVVESVGQSHAVPEIWQREMDRDLIQACVEHFKKPLE